MEFQRGGGRRGERHRHLARALAVDVVFFCARDVCAGLRLCRFAFLC